MSFVFDVSLDVKDVEKQLTNLQKKQLPFATARALTKTAQEVKKAEVNAIKQNIDRPTRYTINSVRVIPAKKNKLEATVMIMNGDQKVNPPIEWLSPQIHSGARKHKRFELALINAKVMKRSEYTSPGGRAKLNRYGNVTKSVIHKILSDIKKTHKGRLKHYYFAEINGQRGIWRGFISGGDAHPVLMFVKRPKYKTRIKFYKIAKAVTKARFVKNFHRSLRQALATAR